ncbi:unnamed protein product [Periconia digitata]|uniref:Uncharacterized protein n=1 Tax=Periconia digitata TaxID=1303443 RepID=A0A9W4U0S7_9PLEO|nr:unnamed protein product [Periconia digitata]
MDPKITTPIYPTRNSIPDPRAPIDFSGKYPHEPSLEIYPHQQQIPLPHENDAEEDWNSKARVWQRISPFPSSSSSPEKQDQQQQQQWQEISNPRPRKLWKLGVACRRPRFADYVEKTGRWYCSSELWRGLLHVVPLAFPDRFARWGVYVCPVEESGDVDGRGGEAYTIYGINYATRGRCGLILENVWPTKEGGVWKSKLGVREFDVCTRFGEVEACFAEEEFVLIAQTFHTIQTLGGKITHDIFNLSSQQFAEQLHAFFKPHDPRKRRHHGHDCADFSTTSSDPPCTTPFTIPSFTNSSSSLAQKALEMRTHNPPFSFPAPPSPLATHFWTALHILMQHNINRTLYNKSWLTGSPSSLEEWLPLLTFPLPHMIYFLSVLVEFCLPSHIAAWNPTNETVKGIVEILHVLSFAQLGGYVAHYLLDRSLTITNVVRYFFRSWRLGGYFFVVAVGVALVLAYVATQSLVATYVFTILGLTPLWEFLSTQMGIAWVQSQREGMIEREAVRWNVMFWYQGMHWGHCSHEFKRDKYFDSRLRED